VTLRDALATALASHDDPDFGYPAGWAPADFADAILADPTFRIALTASVAVATETVKVALGAVVWYDDHEGGEKACEWLTATIVARMLGETS